MKLCSLSVQKLGNSGRRSRFRKSEAKSEQIHKFDQSKSSHDPRFLTVFRFLLKARRSRGSAASRWHRICPETAQERVHTRCVLESADCCTQSVVLDTHRPETVTGDSRGTLLLMIFFGPLRGHELYSYPPSPPPSGSIFFRRFAAIFERFGQFEKSFFSLAILYNIFFLTTVGGG